MTGTAPAEPPLFQLEAVSLTIDDHTILDNIDLAIADEGITVLAGPSGSGKSTMLRLLNRLEVPTSGQVRFRGQPLVDIDPLALRRRVGMVFQQPTPFPGTVRENLLVAEAHATDDEMAATLAIGGLPRTFLDRSADDLSGGELQRMVLARTLMTQPEVLLMDEPTSALDPEARERLEQSARRFVDRGNPLVWVTHDLDQVARLADAVVVVADGRIAPPTVRDHYLRTGTVTAEGTTTPGGLGGDRRE